MPSKLVIPETLPSGITKLTNCRLIRGTDVVEQDIWISSETGTILPAQAIFFECHLAPDRVIDLGGRIVSPGFIDVQFNGAYGFDFSHFNNPESYQDGIRQLNLKLLQTGLTSYLPTIITQKPELYHKALPYLAASGAGRCAADGAESLGAHVEGPFMNPVKKGVHNLDTLRTAPQGMESLEACYGRKNLAEQGNVIKMITAAPEVEGIMGTISELRRRGIVFSIGHTEADYELSKEAVTQGATTITHLFNAMKPLHHRNPGIFGLMGQEDIACRPFFGLIADGIHLHPTTIKIASNAHPSGTVLVTDALALMGLDDGVYDWINGDRIRKEGPNLTKDGTSTIAGGCATLVQCLNNFLSWTAVSLPLGIAAVTSTPAKMLGLHPQKGSLQPGADADLCVLSETSVIVHGRVYKELVVDQVWKFGRKVFDRDMSSKHVD